MKQYNFGEELKKPASRTKKKFHQRTNRRFGVFNNAENTKNGTMFLSVIIIIVGFIGIGTLVAGIIGISNIHGLHRERTNAGNRNTKSHRSKTHKHCGAYLAGKHCNYGFIGGLSGFF